MISKGEKEKQSKNINNFIEQNVQGINKIGVAASSRHVHKKGSGGLLPPPPFLWRPILFIPWTLCSMNLFRSFLCFSFSPLLIIRGRAYFIYEWMNEWTTFQTRVQHNNNNKNNNNNNNNNNKNNNYNNNYNNNGALVARGVRKGRFQQWDTSHKCCGNAALPGFGGMRRLQLVCFIQRNVRSTLPNMPSVRSVRFRLSNCRVAILSCW